MLSVLRMPMIRMMSAVVVVMATLFIIPYVEHVEVNLCTMQL